MKETSRGLRQTEQDLRLVMEDLSEVAAKQRRNQSVEWWGCPRHLWRAAQAHICILGTIFIPQLDNPELSSSFLFSPG